MIVTQKREPHSINFGATGRVAKLQCIDFALATTLGTLFLMREFGWEPPISESVTPELESTTAGEIFELLYDNIDNIEIGEIDFKYGEGTHQIVPIVEVELLDE